MDLSFSDDQRLLKDSAERFVAQRYDFAARRRIAALRGRFSPDIWQAMAEMGWLGLPLPLDDNGFGGSALDVGIVMEALGRGLVLEPYLSTVVQAGQLIAGAGSPAQRTRWLAPIAAGQQRVALAHGESMFESLGGMPDTRVEVEGESRVIRGTKCLVTDAPGADWFIVSATRAGGELVFFMIPREAPGLEVQSFDTLDGRLAANLRLDGVVVSGDQCLDAAADNAALLSEILDRTAAALCAEAVGCLQHLLDATVAYTRTRVQFDRPIASNQVLRHRMVDMAIQCEESRAMALRAALAIDGDPAARQREVSGAKLKISRAARQVAEGAIQLHGAMGVTDELDVGAYAKRLMTIEKLCGTPAEHRDRLAGLRAARGA